MSYTQCLTRSFSSFNGKCQAWWSAACATILYSHPTFQGKQNPNSIIFLQIWIKHEQSLAFSCFLIANFWNWNKLKHVFALSSVCSEAHALRAFHPTLELFPLFHKIGFLCMTKGREEKDPADKNNIVNIRKRL